MLYVDFRKWPETAHWHFTVHPLGEDEHGRWFCLPAGARVQRGAEEPRIYPQATALVLRDDLWWVGYWNADREAQPELYIDIATPARWSPGRVTLIDLDLDVVRSWQGEVEIVDRDEFELHQVELAYPRELIEAAERTASEVADLVVRRAEPFGDVGRAWLERAIAFGPVDAPGRGRRAPR